MCSTPKRNESSSLDDNTFTPVIVPDSPVTKTPQRGNLTGHPRKVRDSSADLFNSIQEWNRQQLLGVQILRNIIALKEIAISDQRSGHGEKDNGSKFPEGLQEQCDLLEDVCIQMGVVISTMKTIVHELKALVELERFQGTPPEPMFLTWPTDRFGQTCAHILKAYEEEYLVKTCVKENVAHCTTKENLNLHLISWVQQPYIDSDIEMAVEMLLQETGLRIK